MIKRRINLRAFFQKDSSWVFANRSRCSRYLAPDLYRKSKTADRKYFFTGRQNYYKQQVATVHEEFPRGIPGAYAGVAFTEWTSSDFIADHMLGRSRNLFPLIPALTGQLNSKERRKRRNLSKFIAKIDIDRSEA